MSATQAVFLLLFALDAPSGPNLPDVITRFDGPQTPAIQAEFIRFPENAAATLEIEWFLDGGGVLAPVAISPFVYSRVLAEDPFRLRGSFALDLPKVDKVTRFRGVIHARGEGAPSAPVATFTLNLFPEGEFTARWQALANADIPLCLSGGLGGWRDFLQSQNIAFDEVDPTRPASIDRNGFLLADLTPPLPPLFDHPAKSVLIYAGTNALPEEKNFQVSHVDRMLWLSRTPPADVANDPAAQVTFLQLAERLIPAPTTSKP